MDETTQLYIAMAVVALVAIFLIPLIFRAVWAVIVLAILLLILSFGLIVFLALPVVLLGLYFWRKRTDQIEQPRNYRNKDAMTDDEAMRFARKVRGGDWR